MESSKGFFRAATLTAGHWRKRCENGFFSWLSWACFFRLPQTSSSEFKRTSFKCQEGQVCHQTTVCFFCWERVLGLVSPGKSLASVCGDTNLSLHPNGVFFKRISTVKSWYSSKKNNKKIRAPCVGILQSEFSA